MTTNLTIFGSEQGCGGHLSGPEEAITEVDHEGEDSVRESLQEVVEDDGSAGVEEGGHLLEGGPSGLFHKSSGFRSTWIQNSMACPLHHYPHVVNPILKIVAQPPNPPLPMTNLSPPHPTQKLRSSKRNALPFSDTMRRANVDPKDSARHCINHSFPIASGVGYVGCLQYYLIYRACTLFLVLNMGDEQEDYAHISRRRRNGSVGFFRAGGGGRLFYS
ncbi:hypothetical protein L1987_57934 [Smallanthus sonchifolius]|uniref:Uncharacterized protein n=1 Tax=Smallanthus sonchifolius TaxID=185202 RepID=A0ACB9DEC9_9ASTR|nr:hypothetical protein L1987_57934 [Smallanthus sonchifolius]